MSVWFPTAGQVELRREAIPKVQAGEVRIRAIASALSHGTEMLVYRGEVPPGLSLDLPTLRGSFAFPIKYGYASVGRVMERGKDVATLQPNDLVFVHHPHQTEYVVPASMPILLPPNVHPERAALFANLETAVTVLLDAHPRLAERVLIMGQGVVGLLITQLLRRVGVELIVAVDPLEHRRSLSRHLGADLALSPAESVKEQVLDLTGGAGVDLAIEVSGNPSALAETLDCVTFGGTVVVCSWYGTKAVPLPLGGAFHRGRLRLVSSQVGSIDPALPPRWNRERRCIVVRNLLPYLELSPLISHRVPMDRAPDAYALVDRSPQDVVQVIFTYGEDDV